MKKTFDERIAELNSKIGESKKIVFFSGAGVSTDSGIPDFRSKDGLYNNRGVQFEQYPPEYLLSKKCLYGNPKVFFEFYRQKLDCRGAQPNVTHLKMAELEKSGKRVSVITQNVDGLHELAGSTRVYAIHGTTKLNYCTECDRGFSGEEGDFIFESEDDVPACPDCGAMVRPEVVLYGESVMDGAWTKAVHDLYDADLFIVCGTSLTVYPAASLVRYVPASKLVIVNRDETPADDRASLVFHEELAEVFGRIKV